MPHSLRARLKNLQRKGELTEKDIDRIFNALEQDPCEDCEHNDGECCRILFERSFEQEPTDEWQNGYDRAWEETEVFYEKEEPTIEAYRQVCKERDIAIEQLHELGYEFGQKIEPCDDVVSRQAVLDCATLITSIPTEDWDIGDWVCLFRDRVSQLPHVRPQEQISEQWQELKETIIEMRDNDGTGTQQEVCKFLANYMEVLEKQMVEPQERSDKE